MKKIFNKIYNSIVSDGLFNNKNRYKIEKEDRRVDFIVKGLKRNTSAELASTKERIDILSKQLDNINSLEELLKLSKGK